MSEPILKRSCKGCRFLTGKGWFVPTAKCASKPTIYFHPLEGNKEEFATAFIKNLHGNCTEFEKGGLVAALKRWFS